MKKVKFSGKISFKKETVAKLNDEQMSNIMGGSSASAPSCCSTLCAPTSCFVTCGTINCQ